MGLGGGGGVWVSTSTSFFPLQALDMSTKLYQV